MERFGDVIHCTTAAVAIVHRKVAAGVVPTDAVDRDVIVFHSRPGANAIGGTHPTHASISVTRRQSRRQRFYLRPQALKPRRAHVRKLPQPRARGIVRFEFESPSASTEAKRLQEFEGALHAPHALLKMDIGGPDSPEARFARVCNDIRHIDSRDGFEGF